MLRSNSRRAFTLIELLVAVAIFSGIIVLALGAFARSANSSIKSSAIRERTEAARTVVDRIGNDIQYLYTDQPFQAGINECNNSTGPVQARGFFFDESDCLFMVLQYPDSAQLAIKRYGRLDRAVGSAVYDTLFLEEARECQINAGLLSCGDRNVSRLGTVISEKFLLAGESEPVYLAEPLFAGIMPEEAATANPVTTAILRVNVVVKAAIDGSLACQLDSSHCYTIKTSFVAGS
jgi:prepilin-type N-terminal cleavage/methylation domain-containing protein